MQKPGLKNDLSQEAAGVMTLPTLRHQAEPALRVLRIIGGTALCGSALAIWLVSSNFLAAELAGMKLAVSMAMLYIGIVLLKHVDEDPGPEIQLDLDSGELREVTHVPGNRPIVRRHRFSDLSAIRMDGQDLVVENQSGTEMLRAPVADRDSRKRLQALLA